MRSLVERMRGAAQDPEVRRCRDSAPEHLLEKGADEIERLREVLKEIARGAGPFDRDPLEFARNVIEAMKAAAKAALRGECSQPPAESGEEKT